IRQMRSVIAGDQPEALAGRGLLDLLAGFVLDVERFELGLGRSGKAVNDEVEGNGDPVHPERFPARLRLRPDDRLEPQKRFAGFGISLWGVDAQHGMRVAPQRPDLEILRTVDPDDVDAPDVLAADDDLEAREIAPEVSVG